MARPGETGGLPSGQPSVKAVMEAADDLDARRRRQIANQVETINHLKGQLFLSYRIINAMMKEQNLAAWHLTMDQAMEHSCVELTTDDEETSISLRRL